MGLLLIMLLVLMGFSLIDALGKPETKGQPDVEIVQAKTCPPHKWKYVEVKDTNGNTVRWKIVCDVCGPLNASERPSGGDYS